MRKRPQMDKAKFLQRWSRELAVAIPRRGARMIQSCVPKSDWKSEWYETAHCTGD